MKGINFSDWFVPEPNDTHFFPIETQRANNTPFTSQERKLGAPNFTSTNIANKLSIWLYQLQLQGGSTQLLWLLNITNKSSWNHLLFYPDNAIEIPETLPDTDDLSEESSLLELSLTWSILELLSLSDPGE